MIAYLIYLLHSFIIRVRNGLRRLTRAPEYVVFTIEGEYERLRPPRGPFWQRFISPPPPNLQDLEDQLRTVAHDPRVKGAVLHLKHIALPMAHIQTIIDLVRELKRAGKRTVAWSHTYDDSNYLIACSCDEILLQPGGSIAPLGLRQSFVFLKDALASVGIKADLLQISPYKTAGDVLTRSEMSPEMREMVDWLLDSLYSQQLSTISEGRGCDESGARKLVDDSPYTDLEALEARAVDAIVSEEDLPKHLAADERPASLATWDEARRRLFKLPPKRPGRYIALLRIEGLIVEGRSGRPPGKPPLPVPMLFDARTGDLTFVQQARKVLRDKRAAALVVYIDSRGGSASASEAIAAALKKVAEKKPVVVAMGAVAGSGGYYVATPGRHILSQPATITGSIGVLGGKLVSFGMFEKLRMNRELLTRGRRAAMLDPGRPFTEEERHLMRGHIERAYEVFLERVTQSRKLSRSLDEIAGGRVWTGEQALRHGLIDELGGLDKAIEKARELGGLDKRAAVREIPPQRRALAPQSPKADILSYALEGLELLRSGALYLCPWLFDQT